MTKKEIVKNVAKSDTLKVRFREVIYKNRMWLMDKEINYKNICNLIVSGFEVVCVNTYVENERREVKSSFSIVVSFLEIFILVSF